MREIPSREILESSSTPSMVLMISSSGFVTLVSISSGDAPRKVVVTVMIGSSTFGNRSVPIRWKENQPSTTSSRFIIVAKTGRRMQTAARFVPPEAGRELTGLGSLSIRLLHSHLCTVVKFRLAGDDDALAGFHAGNNFLLVVDHASDFHGACLRDAVLDYEHFADADKIHNGIERHDGRGNVAFKHQFAARKRVRAQLAIGILHQRTKGKRARGRVHLWTD